MNDMAHTTATDSATPSSTIIHHTLESFVASRGYVQGADGGHYEYAKDSALIIEQHSELSGGHYLTLPNGDEYQGGREELESILFYDWYAAECTDFGLTLSERQQ